ncbi:RCC1 and BTB domain-containing protein 2-like [Folsomia candida]|uniref:RCC1 and BTB domain-containing protein 2-like n=1 Tax=Folsomia candida TaxID=158441 RepID=UPI0016052341|nr:RCC1 and BTB domain-containing protein 2-like [Folsomia candida]
MGDLVELSTFKLTQRTIPLKELRKWKLFNTIGDSFLENVRVAHAHKQFGFLVTTDDNVCAFGTGIDGSLGLGSIKQASTPIKINALCGQTVKEFVFGNTGNQCFAITADGRVFGWGINSNGLLGIGTDDKTISTPTLLKFDEGVKIAQISVGLCHALALSLDTAEVFAWGHPLGVGSDIDLNKPCKITTNLQNIKVKQISCGEFTSFVLSESEDVYSWGYNKEGQLGIANTASANVPTKLVIDKLIKKVTKLIDISIRCSMES